MQKHIQPKETLRQEVRQHLRSYNREFLEAHEITEIIFDERDKQGKLLGGLVCTIIGQWLEIDYLWVETSHRSKGLGSRLLIEAEKEALEHGCKYGVLHTYGFQARPFYEKHGYQVVYTQKNFPIVSDRYHMTKTL